MPLPIACGGAPRDMGFDQGSACRPELARRYAASPLIERVRWRAGWRRARVARVARDVARHFPRHVEAIQGMARGARVPRAWLESLLADCADDPSERDEPRAVGAAASEGGLARTRAPSWVLRRARPEGGFACLELAPPWLTGALAAVSEVGLAAAVVPRPVGPEPARCAAPALLLLQDALHRSESLAGAVEWCLRRPAGGRATLLFAGAGGELAGLVVDGAERRVLRPEDGLLVEAGPAGAGLAKVLRDEAGAAALARSLGAPGVVLDPAGRRLALSEASGRLDWLALDRAPGEPR